jgi:hypothetical protein
VSSSAQRCCPLGGLDVIAAWTSSRPGGVGGSEVGAGTDERGDVPPASMFESGVGGHFDHNVGSHSDDLDLLAAPVANVAATDERWPRMVLIGGDEERRQRRLLGGRQGGCAADDLQAAPVV